MATPQPRSQIYSIIIAVHPDDPASDPCTDWRLGEISVDWVDFTREKSVDQSPAPRKDMSKRGGTKKKPSPDSLSLQPLLAHFPGPNPLESSVASGVTQVGRGVVHLFRHAPPASLIASLDGHPVGEASGTSSKAGGEWDGDRAEGEDGSLIAILAVPAWMRPADFLEFLGGWGTCLEGVRMIREATTPNRSIVLLKFRDPLQAADFLVIFTGRAFSTLDTRETCHPIRIHHLLLHKVDSQPIAIPAFPPSVYGRPDLLKGVPVESRHELPSCPVCLERLDSTITGLVTLPCAHTFDCDCLRKWGDSRCPVCRVSHLLLSSSSQKPTSPADTREITRVTKCSMCDSEENNWICVVCGVVGCGRYDPGKGHARRHWEESGHVLAMELETQRVWDYNGDNYVHRLIQSRNGGKLVELPSASSLVTPSFARLATPQQINPSRSTSSPLDNTAYHTGAGPSNDDLEKISTIESITLEYSYLLSSQLEAMRQHYESQTTDHKSRLAALEDAHARARESGKAKEDAEKAREKAERRAEKATELSRSLQASLSAEKAMSQGLSTRVTTLRKDAEKMERESKEREEVKKELEEVKRDLEETLRDLMFSLEAGAQIQANGGGAEGGEGGSLVVVRNDKEKKKKKGKK